VNLKYIKQKGRREEKGREGKRRERNGTEQIMKLISHIAIWTHGRIAIDKKTMN
jgi:hypothetical protein